LFVVASLFGKPDSVFVQRKRPFNRLIVISQWFRLRQRPQFIGRVFEQLGLYLLGGSASFNLGRNEIVETDFFAMWARWEINEPDYSTTLG
jgi:hypothetical protein